MSGDVETLKVLLSEARAERDALLSRLERAEAADEVLVRTLENAANWRCIGPDAEDGGDCSTADFDEACVSCQARQLDAELDAALASVADLTTQALAAESESATLRTKLEAAEEALDGVASPLAIDGPNHAAAVAHARAALAGVSR